MIEVAGEIPATISGWPFLFRARNLRKTPRWEVSAETPVPCIPPPVPPERGSRSRPISAWPALSGWYVSGRERFFWRESQSRRKGAKGGVRGA